MPRIIYLYVVFKHVDTLTSSIVTFTRGFKRFNGQLNFCIKHCMDLKKDGVDPMISIAIVVKLADFTRSIVIKYLLTAIFFASFVICVIQSIYIISKEP